MDEGEEILHPRDGRYEYVRYLSILIDKLNGKYHLFSS
jgi:hypothetical protein